MAVTHYALITGPTTPEVDMIAGGSEDWCRESLATYLAEHPLSEGQMGEVVARVSQIEP